MIIVGGVLFAVSVGILIYAALPARMTIHRRANLFLLGGCIAWVGLFLYVEGIAPTSPNTLSIVCGSGFILGGLVVVRFLLIRRLRLNQRDWREKWQYQDLSPLRRDLFKRYHDID
jgi:hypothetical protein